MLSVIFLEITLYLLLCSMNVLPGRVPGTALCTPCMLTYQRITSCQFFFFFAACVLARHFQSLTLSTAMDCVDS